ncbi:MAG: NTP transferase domain-containing protein [Melioribacteraceae bacterium]|nr:NTP transferase domain-containing protein [Melioribacteraceae bacterium]
MKAVILAGGLGTRLLPFTQIIPKPLLPVGEKSVLQIQMEQLKKCGFDQIYLATNYKSDYIENFFGDGQNYGVKLKFSKEEKPLGTIGPLTLLKNELTEPFLLMNGDILTLLKFNEMYDFALKQSSLLTIGIKEYIMPFDFGNVFFDGDYVTSIEEKPNLKNNILAGVYVLNPSIFQYIPENTYFGMDNLLHFLLDNNMPIIKYEIKEYWLDIGQVGDYTKAQEVYNKHFK